MTSATNQIIGIHRQRGLWLRCFLGVGSILAIMFAIAVENSHGQIAILKPLHLSRVHGYVLDEAGSPLSEVQVALASEAQPSLAAVTDAKGYFDFPNARGEYFLHVVVRGSQTASRRVIAGADIRAWVHREPLYIMIMPGLCNDCESPVFTSRKRFDRALRDRALAPEGRF